MKGHSTGWVGVLLLGLVLAGCAAPGETPALLGPADLVAIPKILSFDPVSISFCQRDDQGNLVVVVRNQGGTSAPASVTKVSFGAAGSFELSTADLMPGDVVHLAQAIPDGCFDPDCDFTITVDDTSQVAEGPEGETNNSISDSCIG